MSTLARAIAVAAQAHIDQKDKSGAPYILHPLRIMLRMDTEAEMMVAVLHDVVEDTDWSIDKLRSNGFPEVVLTAVESVTHREGESYDDFVARAAANPIGRRVKLADLEDNMDVRRIDELADRDLERVRKYHRAWRILTNTPR
ncbi:MAG TPA: GTP pyrophosphokinase [Vicinamibacteria bacterium]|jgi:(p)ppGpp synthase/HD superfamily hydrolase|nr:GTP pyrophosphokinase [Vicinamibacteria bacterium]